VPLIHPSRLRLGIKLITALTVVSSFPLLILNNTLLAPTSSPPYSTGPNELAAPSTICQGGDFGTQPPLQFPRTLQSIDIVNSLAIYEVTFITSTTGAIDKIRMDFPASTKVAAAGVIERIGIGGGTLLKSGSSITYDVQTPVSIPAGTFIRLEIFGIKNPSGPSTSYTATITTRDSGGNLMDGPSLTNVDTMRQIGTNDIADGSVTMNKPAQGFMKRITLLDNAAGNALGWNPDGVLTAFDITEPGSLGEFIGYVSAPVRLSGVTNCQVGFQTAGEFSMDCEFPPVNGAQLPYVVVNLPGIIL
jgi:hypothetical protein